MTDKFNRTTLRGFYDFLTYKDVFGRSKSGLSAYSLDESDLSSIAAAILDVDDEKGNINVLSATDTYYEIIKTCAFYGFTPVVSSVYVDADQTDGQYLPPFNDTAATTTMKASSYWAKKNSGASREFWKSVCGASPTSPPKLPFIVNQIRSPALTLALKHAFPVEVFLNYLPPLVASNMMPYFDVEMIMPNLDDEYISGPARDDSDANYKRHLGTPSLLRFLEGSIKLPGENIHPADMSLIQKSKFFEDTRGLYKEPPTTPTGTSSSPGTTAAASVKGAPGGAPAKGTAETDPFAAANKGFVDLAAALAKKPAAKGKKGAAPAPSVKPTTTPIAPKNQAKYYAPNQPGNMYSTGMELFTAPQTLINMDTLRANGSSKLLDSKPFLPLATITAASINLKNAGAGATLHTTATLDIKLHDKSRIGEFSEFLRGHSGTKRAIVRLTYGWLAPTSAGDKFNDTPLSNDYYDFINENMMVQRDFTVMNSSYSFDALGQVLIKVQLVSKGMGTFKTKNLKDTFAAEPSGFAAALANELERIKQLRPSFGDKPEGFEGDVRIFQLLNEPLQSDGSMRTSIPKLEREKLFNSAREFVNKRADSKEKAEALELIKNVESWSTVGGSITKHLRVSSRNFIKNKLDVCYKMNSPDPFLPTAEKNEDLKKEYQDWVGWTKELLESIDRLSKNDNFTSFDDELWDLKPYSQLTSEEQKAHDARIKSLKNSGGTRRVVSFGKVFSVFALPSIIKMAEEEGIDEVKVNFFQLNESVGPMSGINIADFPIDLDMLTGQLSDFVAKRGGDAMTIEEFITFMAETQIADRRSPGYGMSEYYLPYSPSRPELTQRPDEQVKSSGGGGGGATPGGGGDGLKETMYVNEKIEGLDSLIYYLRDKLSETPPPRADPPDPESFTQPDWAYLDSASSYKDHINGGGGLSVDTLTHIFKTKGAPPDDAKNWAEQVSKVYKENVGANEQLQAAFDKAMAGAYDLEYLTGKTFPTFTIDVTEAYRSIPEPGWARIPDLNNPSGTVPAPTHTGPEAKKTWIAKAERARHTERGQEIRLSQAATAKDKTAEAQTAAAKKKAIHESLLKEDYYSFAEGSLPSSKIPKYQAYGFRGAKPTPTQLKEFNNLSEDEQNELILMLGQAPRPEPNGGKDAFSPSSSKYYGGISKSTKKAAGEADARARASRAEAAVLDAKRWKFANKIGEWFARWKTLKIPALVMKVDTLVTGEPISNANLFENYRQGMTSNELKVNFNKTVQEEKNIRKSIMRIDLYDAHAVPSFERMTPSGYVDSLKNKKGDLDAPIRASDTSADRIKLAGKKYSKSVEEVFEKYRGLDALEKFVGTRVPKIMISTNGSLAYNVQLASKTDSLLSTAHMQAGTFKTRSTLSPSGLQMKEYDLPIRVLPAQLTMNTKGCPLIEPYQDYYINFETGTQLDNIYKVLSVTHNISLGKFETSLSLTPVDGFAHVINYMTDLESVLEKYKVVSPSGASAPMTPTSWATNASAAALKNAGGSLSTGPGAPTTPAPTTSLPDFTRAGDLTTIQGSQISPTGPGSAATIPGPSTPVGSNPSPPISPLQTVRASAQAAKVPKP